MKARDADAWTQQTVELRADENGQRFLTFFEFWFDAAEKLISDGLDAQMCNGTPSNAWTPVRAMREALKVSEEQLGFLTVDWIGQMLAVASMHWAHGQEMVKGLTFVEHRLVQESVARKVAQLAEDAKIGSTVPN